MPRIRIKTYGCRLNVCDSEIISSILHSKGYDDIDEYNDAENTEILLLNCCSVREDGHVAAMRKVHDVLNESPNTKIIVCGCYATLLNQSLFLEEPSVYAIVRPNAYFMLPNVIERVLANEKHFIVNDINNDDCYEDVIPHGLSVIPNRTVVVAKGCNQNCAYCIEPITRGHERYISPDVIMRNVDVMLQRDIDKEITLIGHLLDRYNSNGVDFPQLLDAVATRCAHNNVAVKYFSSHPSTYSDEILDVVLAHKNILRVVHLPVQSGSDFMLRKMHRGYTVSDFVYKVNEIRKRCPDMQIVTDIMVGFCGETDSDFEASVNLVKAVKPSDINVYKFSMRQHTYAYKHYDDDVDEALKVYRYNYMKQLVSQLR